MSFNSSGKGIKWRTLQILRSTQNMNVIENCGLSFSWFEILLLSKHISFWAYLIAAIFVPSLRYQLCTLRFQLVSFFVICLTLFNSLLEIFRPKVAEILVRQMKIHCRFIDWISRMRAPQQKSIHKHHNARASKFNLIFFFVSIRWLHLPLFLLLSLSRSSAVSPWPISRNGQKAAKTQENQLQTAESQNSYFLFTFFFFFFFRRFSLRWMNDGKTVHKSIRRFLVLVRREFFFLIFCLEFFSFCSNHDYMCLHACIVFLILFYCVFFFLSSLCVLWFPVVVQFSLWLLFSLLCYLFVCVSVCFAFRSSSSLVCIYLILVLINVHLRPLLTRVDNDSE